jgi:hypothetical protein
MRLPLKIVLGVVTLSAAGGLVRLLSGVPAAPRVVNPPTAALEASGKEPPTVAAASALLVPHPVQLNRQVEVTPIKIMIIEDYLLDQRPGIDLATRFLMSRRDEILAGENCKDQVRPVQIFISLYESRAHYQSQEGLWLGQLRHQVTDGEPSTTLDFTRLINAELKPEVQIRHGLPLSRRKELYVFLRYISRRARENAERAIPVAEPGQHGYSKSAYAEGTRRQETERERQRLVVEEGLAKTSGIPLEILEQIRIEGLEHGWPSSD